MIGFASGLVRNWKIVQWSSPFCDGPINVCGDAENAAAHHRAMARRDSAPSSIRDGCFEQTKRVGDDEERRSGVGEDREPEACVAEQRKD